MLKWKKFVTYLLVLMLGCLGVMPIHAEGVATPSDLAPKQTYYEVTWNGENENIIGTQDEVYIDAYYSFNVGEYIGNGTTLEDIMAAVTGSGEAAIAADSYFVTRGSVSSSLNVEADREMSNNKTLVIKVTNGSSKYATLRYLGNGSYYSISGYAEFDYIDANGDTKTKRLSLDEKFAITETKTVEDKKDFPKDIYVTGYTLVGEPIDKNTPFNIGVNVVDPNFTYSSMNGKSFDKSFAILTGSAFGSNNRQGYINDVRPDTMGYLMYTVWFENVRYLADGTLDFSVSYTFDYSENGKSYNADQSKSASTPIYEINNGTGGSSNFTPNVIISNYTGQNGMVAGKNAEIKVDFKNTNSDVDVHNVVITVKTGEAFTQTKGVNKFFVDTITAGETSSITLNVTSLKTIEPGSYPIDFDYSYEYVSGGTTKEITGTGQISIPVTQIDRLQVSYVKMSNVYQNSESEVSYSIINGGMSTLLNTNLEIVNANGEVLGSMYLGKLEPGKEAKGTNIYITFPEAGEQALKARITYEDINFNVNTVEEDFTVNVMANGGWSVGPEFPIEPEMPMEEPKKNNGMLWVGGLVLVVAAGLGFVIYKKKKNKGVIDDEDL